jgi:hypothetical protein
MKTSSHPHTISSVSLGACGPAAHAARADSGAEISFWSASLRVMGIFGLDWLVSGRMAMRVCYATSL